MSDVQSSGIQESIAIILEPGELDGLQTRHESAFDEIITRYPVVPEAFDEVHQAMQDWRVKEGLRQLAEFDHATYDHVVGVSLLATHLAILGGVPQEQRRLLTMAAALHDVGKTGVAHDIVNPDVVDSEFDRNPEHNDRRYRAIELHPEIGFLITRNLYRDETSEKVRRLVSELVLTHHCHNDSKDAYPNADEIARLEEEGTLTAAELNDPELQWLGQYLALADVYEAVTARRNYQRHAGLEDPVKVLDIMTKSHPTMEKQIIDLMDIHLQRFPMGWMPDPDIVMSRVY